MDTKHLKRRYNVYWVRVWVPESVREILGKSELWQNLYTTDLKVRVMNIFSCGQFH